VHLRLQDTALCGDDEGEVDASDHLSLGGHDLGDGERGLEGLGEGAEGLTRGLHDEWGVDLLVLPPTDIGVHVAVRSDARHLLQGSLLLGETLRDLYIWRGKRSE
jgi:hypothetical protein